VKLFLRYWLPFFAWITLIFVGSTDLMSAEHTSRFIVPFLRWLDPTISVETLMQAHFYLRKAAHVSEYAVLAALLYRALVNTALRGRVLLSAGIVLIVCGFYAITDEFHQSFVPSRTASARDVAIDSVGALFGLLVIHRFQRESRMLSLPALFSLRGKNTK
jgi:VanZ family protein